MNSQRKITKVTISKVRLEYYKVRGSMCIRVIYMTYRSSLCLTVYFTGKIYLLLKQVLLSKRNTSWPSNRSVGGYVDQIFVCCGISFFSFPSSSSYSKLTISIRVNRKKVKPRYNVSRGNTKNIIPLAYTGITQGIHWRKERDTNKGRWKSKFIVMQREELSAEATDRIKLVVSMGIHVR